MIKKQIASLRRKLPAKGYSAAIIEADKQLSGNPKKARISSDEIKNFFNGRAVSHDNSILIINAAKAAIQAEEKKKETFKRLLQQA